MAELNDLGTSPPSGYIQCTDRSHPDAPPHGVILMHRIVMNAAPGEFVDHIHNIRHDNRKSELRIVSQRANVLNRTKFKPNASSPYVGVCWDKNKSKWMARFCGKFLGYFSTPELASMAYVKASETEPTHPNFKALRPVGAVDEAV